MQHLSQCLGVEKKTRSRVHRDFTALYRRLAQRDVFNGLVRTYAPKDDNGEDLPAETRVVQCKADSILADVRALMVELCDIVATKEWGNTKARADLIVDGKPLLTDVPVTYFLFLEKELNELLTFFEGLPVLDPNENWEQDRSDGFYRSDETTTLKMKKVPRALEKAAATEHHPAQVDVVYEDVTVGEWTRVLRSGALPQMRVDELVRRVVRLRDAVIVAREKANTIEIENVQVGSKLLEYVLGPTS